MRIGFVIYYLLLKKYMPGRAWNNQGGSNRDGFNFKPFKPRRNQVVPPFEDLKESLITSFKISKPRSPRPDYGLFGDAVWVPEFYDDFPPLDIPIEEPPEQPEDPEDPSPNIPTPPIPSTDPEAEAPNVFPFTVNDEYELVVKYFGGLVLIITSGQSYAARNSINDPRFDLAIVIRSSAPISIGSNPASSLNIIRLTNSAQNPIYSLYNWLVTKISIATDYSAQQPDPLLSAIQTIPNTLQLPSTQFTNNAIEHSLFFASGVQPIQICLNAINKVLYFQPTNPQEFRLWQVTYAGQILPLCLNLDSVPPVLGVYRFLAVYIESPGVRLGGYNAANATENLVSPYTFASIGLNIIDPDATDWTGIIRRTPTTEPLYDGMYWQCGFFIIDAFDNIRLQFFKPDGTFLTTGILDYPGAYELAYKGTNTWVSGLAEFITDPNSPLSPSNPSANPFSESFRFYTGEDRRYFKNLYLQRELSMVNTSLKGGNFINEYVSQFAPTPTLNPPNPLPAIFQLKARSVNETIIANKNYEYEALSPRVDNFSGSIPGTQSSYTYRKERLRDLTYNDFEIGYEREVSLSVTQSALNADITYSESFLYRTWYNKEDILLVGQKTIRSTISVPLHDTDIVENEGFIAVASNFGSNTMSLTHDFTAKVTHRRVFIDAVELFLSPSTVEFLVDSASITPSNIDTSMESIFVGNRFIEKITNNIEITGMATPYTDNTDPLNPIDYPNAVTYQRNRTTDYFCVEDSLNKYIKSGSFVIINNFNVINCTATGTQSVNSSTEDSNYRVDTFINNPLSVFEDVDGTITIDDSIINTSVSESFNGFDSGHPILVGDEFNPVYDTRKINGIDYIERSSYSHILFNIVPANKSTVLFINIAYFDPKNTIIAAPTASETGLIAHLFKSTKKSQDEALVEKWVVHDDGWVELRSIETSPLGIYTGTTDSLYYYPADAP